MTNIRCIFVALFENNKHYVLSNLLVMKVFRTNFGKGIYLSDSELVSLGFIAVNLLGKTGIPFLDEYSQKTVPTILSDGQLSVLEELLTAIRKELQNG